MRPHSFVIPMLAVALLVPACGSSEEADSPTQEDEIINGWDVPRSLAASVVRLDIRMQDASIRRCTGTVLSSKTVLTAAHCLEDEGIAGVSIVFMGGRKIEATEPNIVHSDYDRSWNPVEGLWTYVRGSADLAILTLKSDAPSTARPVQFARGPIQFGDVRLVGFGATTASGEPRKTMRGAIGLVAASYREWFRTTGSTDGCHGDDGGPAFNEAGELVGIFVKGSATCDKTYLLHASWYEPWIRPLKAEGNRGL